MPEPTSIETSGDEPVADHAAGASALSGASGEELTLRQTAGPVRLLFTAMGGPRQVGGKLARLARTLVLFLNSKEIERRLSTLHERGYIDVRPGRAQIFFGGFDMLRFMIAPGARDYYTQRGISFGPRHRI